VTETPEIIENFRDFEPPANFGNIVDDLVRYVPPEFLLGLQSITLTNRIALSRNQKRQKTWSRNRKIRLADALGYYTPATRSSRAAVVLYVDNITQGWPGWLGRVPLVRYMPAGEVLYHEIGHHIHAAHLPVYEGKEDVADYWRRKLWGRFVRRRYWYLFPFIYVAGKIVRIAKRLRK
jgi:hypothetical protein